MNKKKLINDVKLGSDPEVFLYNTKNEEFFSAVGLIKGTKKRPLAMDNLPEGFMWQVDCVALEYNIPPADTLKQWVTYHKKSLNYMKKNIPSELELSITASARFNDNQLKTKQANTFGCDPDLNVWLGRQNEMPDPSTFGNLRSCGGHVSIGYSNPTEEISVEIVKAFDLFLTLPSLFIDEDTERRKLYGKAGSFRFKNFGVECRALSNFWLKDEKYMSWVYKQVHKAIDFVNSENEIPEHLTLLLPQAIDSNNTDLAERICNEFNITIPEKVLLKVEV